MLLVLLVVPFWVRVGNMFSFFLCSHPGDVGHIGKCGGRRGSEVTSHAQVISAERRHHVQLLVAQTTHVCFEARLLDGEVRRT